MTTTLTQAQYQELQQYEDELNAAWQTIERMIPVIAACLHEWTNGAVDNDTVHDQLRYDTLNLDAVLNNEGIEVQTHE